jgi:Flp pilus assembly secretin CpaC
LLSIHFDDGEQLTGDPRLQVRAGQPATIVVGEEPGHRFTLSMIATPASDGTLLITSRIDAVSENGTHRTAQPALTARLSQPAAITFGGDGGGKQPVRVSFTYQPVAARH